MTTTTTPTTTNTQPKPHRWTGPTGKKFVDVPEADGTYYRKGTARPVIDALQSARRTGARVRVYYGDTKTGKDWKDECDVTGTIGRSTGPIKIPLLIPTRRSMGGGAILTDCIVRLLINGHEVYRHPKYKAPQWTTRPATIDGYQVEVLADGESHANFKTEAAAARYIAFMEGRRAAK